MERLFAVAAGIDVHRDTVVVSIRRQNGGREEAVGTRTFETYHDGLVAMAQWLEEAAVEIIGLESTGVYWKPVVRVVQQRLPRSVVWLVNPAQVRKVPGRKTDVSDSQWLARLVMHGLVAPSFLPAAELQELRKLTRHRTKVVADRTRYSNRVLKELESTGVKVASVCSDPLGKTGRGIIDALIRGEALSLSRVEQLACGTLRKKAEQLHRAVQGALTSAARIVVAQLLRRIDDFDRDLAELDASIAERLSPFREEVDRLLEVPGFDHVSAAAVLAETGADMSVFPSAGNLVSWAGLSPGSEESAGKSKKVPTRKGDKYLRTILVQVAMCAKRKKDSYWSQKYKRLIRLGPKKATVALAHKLLCVVYKLLTERIPYRDPATIPPPFHRRQSALARLTAQIKALGYDVTLRPTGVVS